MKANPQKRIYRDYIKRLLDILLSAAAIVLLSPALLLLAVFVRVKLGSPVLFTQPRPGRNEKLFYLYKFRSMTNEKGPDGRLLPDTKRLTKFGKLLRKSSLDELPELVNILRGDMSLVGPRPLSMYYLSFYPDRDRRRHLVRPGLTGLAQVNGRNNLPWEERFRFDTHYVDHVSFELDVKILLDTVKKVFRQADVSVRGTASVGDYGPYSIVREEKEGGRSVGEMTYSEIGSFFWLSAEEQLLGQTGSKELLPGQRVGNEGPVAWLPSRADSCFAISGRAAIAVALRDILKYRSIKKVYLPSYCCVSMLQAFTDRGMTVRFYEVRFENGSFSYQIPDVDNASIVLIMSYFGMDIPAERKAITALREKGAVVIEDITHTLLDERAASEEADYLVASLRKWFAIAAGGWVAKRSGMLVEKPNLESNHAVQEKIAGMREKYEYLSGRITSKEHFLNVQAKFDNDLIHADSLLQIDDLSSTLLRQADVPAIVRQRRENAAYLLQELTKLKTDRIELPAFDLKEATPLFVPVFLKHEDRNALRAYLIQRGIYCPVHWPEVMGATVGVRDTELSLICDQRYSEGDMAEIIACISEWLDKSDEQGSSGS